MNGTYTSQPSDTTGLGEYSTPQLLTELQRRGVMDEIIGEDEDMNAKEQTPIDRELFGYNTADALCQNWWRERVAILNVYRYNLRTRLATILKGERR